MRTLPSGATLLLIGAALTGCIANNAHTTRSTSHKPTSSGRATPEIVGIDGDGKKFQLSDYRGKVVLLDFWAIGCAPCRRELPVVEDLSHHYGGDRLDVLKISSLDDATAMRAWLAKNNYSLDALVDSDWTAANRFKVQGIPSLILIGRDGKIQGYWEGPASQAMLQAAVDRALAR
jgi:thiol-disulfide isomerase/thioredoxin